MQHVYIFIPPLIFFIIIPSCDDEVRSKKKKQEERYSLFITVDGGINTVVVVEKINII